MSKLKEARKLYYEKINIGPFDFNDVMKLKDLYEQSLTAQREELKKKVVEAIQKEFGFCPAYPEVCNDCSVGKKNCHVYRKLTSITTIFSEVNDE